MRIIYREYVAASTIEPDEECADHLFETMGMSCRHMIHHMIAAGHAFSLSEIHEQWHLTIVPHVLPPDVLNSSTVFEAQIGRISAAFAAATPSDQVAMAGNLQAVSIHGNLQEPSVLNHSMARQRSHFERIRTIHCSNCGSAGHNRATCTR